MTIVYREVVGTTRLHPKVFLEMMAYPQKRFSPIGACFGIYPIYESGKLSILDHVAKRRIFVLSFTVEALYQTERDLNSLDALPN